MGVCYRAEDRRTDRYIMIPAALFTEPRLRVLSAESRLVYALLLDRLRLSQRNGWVNGAGEVYLIYPRKEIGEKVGITGKRAGAAVRELIAAGLLREERQGLGRPNLLYPIKLCEDDCSSETEAGTGAQTETSAAENAPSEAPGTRTPEGQKRELLKAGNRPSGRPETDPLEGRKSPASKNNNIQRDFSENPSNQTDNSARAENELETILENCRLCNFTEPTAQMLEDAVRMLYCKKKITVGDSLLPRDQIRRLLRRVDYDVMIDVVETIRQNREDIVNPKGYLYSIILNRVGTDDLQQLFDRSPEDLPMDRVYRLRC